MKEDSLYIELDGEKLIDADFVTRDFYVLITDKGNVITPFKSVRINHSFDFPIIKIIDDEKFLIADSRVHAPTENCSIYDYKGHVLTRFFAGDGIEDIKIVDQKIIINYFDEGIYGMAGPNQGGLVVFEQSGKMLFSYNERHGGSLISDCYCLSKYDEKRVVFLPYESFQLTELDLDSFEEKIHPTPKEIEGCCSMTAVTNALIFHSPYNDKRAFLKWAIGDNRAEKVGEYLEEIKSLDSGKFLSKGESGFTIIDLN